MCLMHQGHPYGSLTLHKKDILPPIIARMIGTSIEETEVLLSELENAQVFSRTPSGAIISRRMQRDERLRKTRAAGGIRSLNNPKVPRPKDQQGYPSGVSSQIPFGPSPSSSSSSPSSSPSSASQITEVGDSPNSHEPPVLSSKLDGSRGLEVSEVFDYWKTKTRHLQAQLGHKRRQAVLGRLKQGYTVLDLKSAIDGCAKSRFHQGENDRGQVFDDLSLICRDEAHVDQFLAIANNGSMGGRERAIRRDAEEFLRRHENDEDDGPKQIR